jgi:hypothetical protein
MSGKDGLRLQEFTGEEGPSRAAEAAVWAARECPDQSVSMMVISGGGATWTDIKAKRPDPEELIHFMHGMAQLADAHKRMKDRVLFLDVMSELRELQRYRLQEETDAGDEDAQEPSVLDEDSLDPLDGLLVDDISVFEPEETETSIRLPYVILRVEASGFQNPVWYSPLQSWTDSLQEALVFASYEAAQKHIANNSLDEIGSDFFRGLRINRHYEIQTWKEAIATIGTQLEAAGGLAYGSRRVV